MAITYVAKEYDTQREHLMGRHSASEAFLKAWILGQKTNSLFSYSRRKKDHEHFLQKVSPWQNPQSSCYGLNSPQDISRHQVEALYTPDPNLAKGAWDRTSTGSAAYSILGVTHTLSSDGAMDLVGNLTTSPVEAWDALICTSKSVRKIVEKLLSRRLENLQENFHLQEPLKPNLPVFPIIPLGVDVEKYPKPKEQLQLRQQWRKKLKLPQDAIVSLFVGRLSFHAKAHPYPMFEALQRCASQTQQPIALILCGWFANDATKDCFIEAAKLVCPSVSVVFVDGRQPETQSTIWSAADIFMSLSDNIQETFGLTPIEAMANGLPIIASDWDGYRETIRHGIDGFRAKTISAPPGHGETLARRHGEGSISYDAFLMESCQQVVVDIDEVTRHLLQLINHPQLRKDMGANGRERALSTYSWNTIAQQYQELLIHLREIRSQATPSKKQPQAHPLRPDPFTLHSHYPTALLSPDTLIFLGEAKTDLMTNLSLKMNQPLRPLDPLTLSTILNLTKNKKALSFSELHQEMGKETKELIRHVLLLGKYGYLRLESLRS